MKREEVREVLECLGDDRRLEYYFKDRYCLDFIKHEFTRLQTDTLKVAELKKGKLSRFLNKPLMGEILSKAANGIINSDDLYRAWPNKLIPYLTTFRVWGVDKRSWCQTTRKQCNLVLQINFDNGHVQTYKKLIAPKSSQGPFEFWSHPVCRTKSKTLGWIRLDISFETDEVLIEEIQNDWLREAESELAYVKKDLAKGKTFKDEEVLFGCDTSCEKLQTYVEHSLKPYKEVWPELAMSAALRLIREVLGVKRVFYHTFDTGKKLKGMGSSPPRSLYTQLPRKFGFEETTEAPQMLLRHKFARRCIKAIKDPRWFRLEV